MRIQIEGMDRARRDLERIGKDLPTVLAQGLNRTMEAVEQAELNAMESHIDRPTPFTMSGIKRFKAKAGRLDAELFIQPAQAKYLKYAIEGGRIPTNLTPVLKNQKFRDYIQKTYQVASGSIISDEEVDDFIGA